MILFLVENIILTVMIMGVLFFMVKRFIELYISTEERRFLKLSFPIAFINYFVSLAYGLFTDNVLIIFCGIFSSLIITELISANISLKTEEVTEKF